MKDKGLYFIGNVKQCSRRFWMEILPNTTLSKQGKRSVLALINKETGKAELVAISWLDRNRCLFVMSTCSIVKGEEINHRRLRQLDKSGQALPDMVIINVPQPKAIATCYEGAGTINRYNRICADKLQMDRNCATKYWEKRINLGILGILCVDAYLFFQQVVHTTNRTMSCPKFFGRLADKLIKNQEGVCAMQALLCGSSGRCHCHH